MYGKEILIESTELYITLLYINNRMLYSTLNPN